MNDIHIFALTTDGVLSAAQGETLCLAADEKKRRLYRTAASRSTAQMSLISQVLLRYAVSRVWGIPMRDVSITYTENGQPQLADGRYCSISHSGALCICAVSTSPVGIDAEKDRPCSLRVADKYFSESEKTLIRTAADPHRAFLAVWTKRESYVKLTGAGIRAIGDPIPPEVHTQTFRFMDAYTVSISEFTNLS